jgi:hypothetical protein
LRRCFALCFLWIFMFFPGSLIAKEVELGLLRPTVLVRRWQLF